MYVYVYGVVLWYRSWKMLVKYWITRLKKTPHPQLRLSLCFCVFFSPIFFIAKRCAWEETWFDLAWDLKLIGHGKTMGPSVYGGWENHQSNGLEPTFSVHIWGLVTPSGRYSYVSESRFVQDTVFSQFAQFFRQLVKSMVIPSSTWPFSSAAKQWRFKSVR